MASTPQFTLIPAGDRERYVPITYYQAINGARASAAFGLDLFADPVCRVALETAREQDRPVLSGRLHSPAPGSARARVLLFLPVFAAAEPPDGEAVRSEAPRCGTEGARQFNPGGWRVL